MAYNPYERAALLDQMEGGSEDPRLPKLKNGNTGVAGPQGQRAPSGYLPTPEQDTPLPVKAGSGKDYQSIFRDVMKNYGYGHAALTKAAPELAKHGFRTQVSQDIVPDMERGRIYTPDGRQINVYDPKEGTTSADNWITNPKGSEWGWQDAGMAPSGSAPEAQPLSMQSVDPRIFIQGGGDANAALQAQIQQLLQRGASQEDIDRQILLSQMEQ